MNKEEAIEALVNIQHRTSNPYDNIKIAKIIKWLEGVRNSE